MAEIDCNLFPEDDACLSRDSPEPRDDMDDMDMDGDWGKGGRGGKGGKMSEGMKDAIVEANIGFLFMTVGIVAKTAFQLFRYRSSETYYDLGTEVLGDRNYWQLSNIIP